MLPEPRNGTDNPGGRQRAIAHPHPRDEHRQEHDDSATDDATRSAPRAALKPAEHPDLSGLLTHFCYRSRPQRNVHPAILAMPAHQRLESILWESQLRGVATYSGGHPAVCLTEATESGLGFLIGRRAYHPWGLVFSRQSVYDVGGGPVWYARLEEYWSLRNLCHSGRPAAACSRGPSGLSLFSRTGRRSGPTAI